MCVCAERDRLTSANDVTSLLGFSFYCEGCLLMSSHSNINKFQSLFTGIHIYTQKSQTERLSNSLLAINELRDNTTTATLVHRKKVY